MAHDPSIRPTIRSPRDRRPLPGRLGAAAALLVAALFGALAGTRILPPAAAQDPSAGRPAPGQAPSAEPGSTVAVPFGVGTAVARQQIEDVLRRTNAALAAPIGDDIDRDMAEKIVAFHQSSIDLAQIVLQLGVDPELRRLAVISVQAESRAVADIRTWLNNRELVRRQVDTPMPVPRTPGSAQ